MLARSLSLFFAVAGLTAAQTPPAAPAVTPLPAQSAFTHPDTSAALSWQASLIGLGEAARPNQWLAFRRTFSIERAPERALARVAVDSKYWLWLNGRLVIREGGLKRGPTPTDTYFDEVDVTTALRPGANTVAVLVWHFGKDGFSHQTSGLAGLAFALNDGEGRCLLASDAAWKARAHPAFGDTGEPTPNFRLAESNIRFDARQDLPTWTEAEFDDANWAHATMFGRVPRAPWNRLVRRPIPLWWESDLRDYVQLSTAEVPARPAAPAPAPNALPSPDPIARAQSDAVATLPLRSAGQLLVARLPYNAQVTPYLDIDAPAGLVIELLTDNYQGGSENNVRAEYVTKAGRQAFECFGWMNGHDVRYVLPAGVTVHRVAYRESGYATAFTGTFRCDDEFLNRLRAKAERTLYVTMRDTYMDCPDRERSQWWGDVVNELGEVFYAFDRRSDALTRKGMLELIGWQKPDGRLFSPVPAGNWDKDLPLQMLAAVGRQGFWTYAFYSGDFETLRVVYPGVKRYLEIWDLQRNGLIQPRPGAWPWGDWGENVDMTLLANIWYHLALQGQRAMALTLNHPEDVPWIDARLRSIESAFSAAFWSGREFRSADHRGTTDDRANALAVVAGLVRTEQFPALLELFRTHESASPYMEKYVLEALCLMHQPAAAQQRMKRRYAVMVDHPGFSTLWEGWGIGAEGYGGGSINHAWSGGPLTIMSQYFAGIAPTEPAFAKYAVSPQLGALRELQASVPTKHGAIQLAIRRSGARFEVDLVSPPGTVADLGLPTGDLGEITAVSVNGTAFDLASPARLPGFAPVARKDPRYLRFELQPGTWKFRVEAKQP